MTRVFKLDNEQDVKDLWDILPDDFILIADFESCTETDKYGVRFNAYTSCMDANWPFRLMIDTCGLEELKRPVETCIGDVGYFTELSPEDSFYNRCFGTIKDTQDVEAERYLCSINDSWYSYFIPATDEDLKQMGLKRIKK